MTKNRRADEKEEDIMMEEEDVWGSLASRRSTAGTGVVTSVHSGAVPFHRFPSMQASGIGLVSTWSRGHWKVAIVPS